MYFIIIPNYIYGRKNISQDHISRNAFMWNEKCEKILKITQLNGN